MLRELALRVLDVYAKLDNKVAHFALISSLRCPDGCGTCCQSEKVEATVLEMLPLAFFLFETNQAELLIKRIERGERGNQCILYRQDFTLAGMWGCSQYHHRAVVCRLFGFSGNKDRTGRPQLAFCRQMKEKTVPASSPEQLSGELLSAMPLFGEAGMMITSLHPGFGTERKPINDAILEALYKVGMHLSYVDSDAADKLNPDFPPGKPAAPAGGGKRKAA